VKKEKSLISSAHFQADAGVMFPVLSARLERSGWWMGLDRIFWFGWWTGLDRISWGCKLSGTLLEKVFGEVARADGRKIKILFGYLESKYNLSSM